MTDRSEHNINLSLCVDDPIAREYLFTRLDVKLSPSTVRNYDSSLSEYVEFLTVNEKSVLTAEFSNVMDYIDHCVRRGNRLGTIKCKISAISSMYHYIRLRSDHGDNLQIDPLLFRTIDYSQYRTPQPIKRKGLSKKEIRLLFDSFDCYRNRLMAIVAIETGIRNSDLRNLRLQDIGDKQLFIHNPKHNRPYSVPISDQLSFELDLWLRCQRFSYHTASNSEFVFPSQHGPKLESNSGLNNIIKQAADKAGIQETIGRSNISKKQQEILNTNKQYKEYKRVTVHTLRHSYITLLEKSGVSLPYRQLVANHTNPSTTLRYSDGMSNVFDEIRDKYNPPR